MKRVNMDAKQLKDLLAHYDVVDNVEIAESTTSATFKDKGGVLIAVVFYDSSGELKQVFIPDYVGKGPFFANSPRAPVRGVQRHGTG